MSTQEIRCLFFGDIVGRVGRRAVIQEISKLQDTYYPDFIIANGENIAHGKGITEATCRELWDAGIDILTLGNHLADKEPFIRILNEERNTIIRPANYPEGTPGAGWGVLEKGNKKLVVLNLLGRALVRESTDDPFRTFDRVFREYPNLPILVDFHAEATSEKKAFGHYVDGRASVVMGTHTHVPTADAEILSGGTGYITDVGMVGFKDSVLGVMKEQAIRGFLTQMPQRFEYAEEGIAEVGACIVSLDMRTNHCTKIQHIRFDSVVKHSV